MSCLISNEKHPADLLHDASCVLAFLCEGTGDTMELGEQAAHGLSLILQAVRQTVDSAAEQL